LLPIKAIVYDRIGVSVCYIPLTGQTKVYLIGICCFSSKHTVLRIKIKDGLAWNQDVSEWSEMSTGGLLFQ